MELDCRKPIYRVLATTAAAALAASLTACGDKPPPETATAKIESAADVAARQAKQAEAAAAEKKKAEAAVKAPDAKAAADRALAAKVKAAITAAPGLKDMAMDVRASDGAVTLFGTADNDAQRRQAETVAAAVPGVKSVKDELQIVRGS